MSKCSEILVTALEKTNKKADVGHVVVTTPGNFDTCFFNKKMYDLSSLRVLVLDEADYMITNENTSNICDKTFKHFQKNNMQVQVLSFSATFTKENFNMFKKYFKKAVMIEMKKEALTLKNVRQMYFRCKKRDEKVEFVEEYLKRSFENERVIIFVNTRDFTAKLQQILISKGYKVYILMGGNMDPSERDLTIKKFNKGEIQILITTNVLSRGFDEKLVKLIINFDLPVTRLESGQNGPDMENYLHRIGRTGRFGTKGIGLTLISDEKEFNMLKEIQNHYASNIEEIKSLDSLMEEFKKTLEDKY
jgi:ATP-dependent RNA helicase DDX19/DBP5